ncbi:gag-pol, partial [Mucuna pruriens]
MMPSTTYRMTPTFGDFVTTKLFAGAFLTPRSIRSSSFVVQHLEVATMVLLGRSGRYSITGPFQVSNGYSYILLAVDYVSRWVKAIATKTNDARVVVDFLKSNIFCRFGVSKALISDQDSHFCNNVMSSLLHKYGVVHRIATAYHPQTNGQAEVFNREIKKMLQKMTNPSRKDWSRHVKDALWAHRTAYQTLLGMSPYQIVFGKACHLLVKIEHRAYWVVKQCNLAYDQVGKQRQFQLQELDELRKHHSRWDGSFVITNAFPYSVVELKDEHTNNTFQVNGHQIKLYHEGPTLIAGDMETISL